MMARPMPMPRPQWRDSLPDEYAWLGQRLQGTGSCDEWLLQLPWIDAIRSLKLERQALVLAHNYQNPLIYHGIADVVGDSLALARAGRDSDAPLLLVCGVGFMAETAKLLAPDKIVLTPVAGIGCSLAESITAADVQRLRQQHPGVPVVCYVNTSAAVKAASDICCTSANAVAVVESLGVPRVLFLPDRHLAAEVARHTAVELIPWPGACEVHVAFSEQEVREWKRDPELRVVAHPECPAGICALADHVGSTQAMAEWLARHRPRRVALITECSMADNLRADFPEIEFVGSCQLCPHMRRIDLPAVYHALRRLEPEVGIDPRFAQPARQALERMLAVARDQVSGRR